MSAFPDAEPEVESKTKDTSKRFTTDQILRRAGFRIKSRPKEGPVIWEREGVTFTQKEALLRLPAGEVKQLTH